MRIKPVDRGGRLRWSARLPYLLQTNSAVDKLNVQAVWVWRFKPPFGSFQVAYQRGTSDIGEVSTQGDTLFTKLSWVF